MIAYKTIVNDWRSRLWAVLILVWQFTFSATAIWLSLSDQAWIWAGGQLLLGINMLQWFFLIHEFGHGGFLPYKAVNPVLGHIASLFCLLPYFPWKQVHHAHHKWTGWREFDPTIPKYTPEQLTPKKVRLMNFCWKYWIPIFAVSYAIETFFNLKQLKTYFPDSHSRRRNAFSIWFIVGAFAVFLVFLGGLFFKIWLLAFLIYISISDPMLLSQHTHLDYKDIATDPVKPVRFVEQPLYTRSVVYPNWVEQFVFYNSNKHGLHHQYPWIPIYYLHKCTEPEENTIYWTQWLKIAKSMPADVLIFSSTKVSGIKL